MESINNAANNAMESVRKVMDPHAGETDSEKAQRLAKESAQAAGDAAKGAAKDSKTSANDAATGAKDSAKSTGVTTTEKIQEMAGNLGDKIRGTPE
jgi:hypothetical protein